MPLAVNVVCSFYAQVGTRYREFFYDRLLPWVHFVPLKGDGSDAFELLEFLRNNDFLAAKIAQNGYDFMRHHLPMESVSAYWEDLLRSFGKLGKYEFTKDESFITIEPSTEEPQYDVTRSKGEL